MEAAETLKQSVGKPWTMMMMTEEEERERHSRSHPSPSSDPAHSITCRNKDSMLQPWLFLQIRADCTANDTFFIFL